MVTIKDIFKAVCNKVSADTGHKLADSDLNEPVSRPSVKIFMDTVDTGFYSSALKRVKVYFNLFFYAENRQKSKSECMEFQQKISDAFLEPLCIKEGCSVFVDALDFEKVEDGILNCSFDFEIAVEFIDESGLETMEELIMNEIVEVTADG